MHPAPDDAASQSTPSSNHGEARHASQPAPASFASAVAVPLIALGLLGAAVWFGSTPTSVPIDHPTAPAITTDPLPSWNEGPTKRAILERLAKRVEIRPTARKFSHDVDAPEITWRTVTELAEQRR